MTIDREEMIAHFSAYGDVTGISMNPTRGYAFIDYRNNECVQTALRYNIHIISHRMDEPGVSLCLFFCCYWRWFCSLLLLLLLPTT